jgi:aspartyl-tRNA(Asn)/glutamyl-tRNA(Gln) amidotransferase subunit B
MGEFSGALNKAGLELADSPVSAEKLGGMVARIVDNTINGKLRSKYLALCGKKANLRMTLLLKKA